MLTCGIMFVGQSHVTPVIMFVGQSHVTALIMFVRESHVTSWIVLVLSSLFVRHGHWEEEQEELQTEEKCEINAESQSHGW